MISQCEQSINQCEKSHSHDDLAKCISDIIEVKVTRELTEKQSEKVRRVESQINEIQKQIEQERLAAQKEKEEQERQAKKQKEQLMKEWEAEVMDDVYRMGRNRGFSYGNDKYFLVRPTEAHDRMG